MTDPETEAREGTAFNEMQQAKRRLFAMRNGIIADTLRKAGSRFPIIFGVNLPQLMEIAADFGANAALAESLWANSTTRESMLLAPMLMPADGFTEDDARRWIDGVTEVEVADILCHKLLRKTPYALSLAKELAQSDDDLRRYTGLRLMCNLAPQHPQSAVEMGRAEQGRDCSLTRCLCLQLIDYEYLLD